MSMTEPGTAPSNVGAAPSGIASVRAAPPAQRTGDAVAAAALGTPGVHGLGGPVTRSLDRASRAVLGSTTRPGVGVVIVDGTTTVDLDVVVEYPRPVHEVADAARRNAVAAVSALADGPVVVNVVVSGVHGPFDPIDEHEESEDSAPAAPSGDDATVDPAVEVRLDAALDAAADAEARAEETVEAAASSAEDAAAHGPRPER